MNSVYIIAGELSGDAIGAEIITLLKKKFHNKIKITGIGGLKMLNAGLESSLFEMSEISIMGFAEVLPKIFKLKKLIKNTIEDIVNLEPAILITIDSPGFCYRVAKEVSKAKLNIKKFHVVAPTVWAYKEHRAKLFAQIYQHLFVILPFEAPYFEKYGLPTTYIGHPCTIKEDKVVQNNYLVNKYNIEDDFPILTLMCGSREGEVQRLLPIFLNTAKLLQGKIPKLHICIIAATISLKKLIKDIVAKNNSKGVMIEDIANKVDIIANSSVILAKSGTNNLEIALYEKPFIVAYKVNFFTYLYLKSAIKIKFACLLNIIAKKEIVPEFLQYNCNPYLMANALYKLLTNKEIILKQVEDTQKVMKSLVVDNKKSCYENIVEKIEL